MCLLFSLLPREKVEAIKRGESVEITAEESSRFQIAFSEAKASSNQKPDTTTP